MSSKKYDKYVEGLALSLGNKLRAKETDTYGILEIKVTEEEKVVYESISLQSSEKERTFATERYLRGGLKTNKEVQKVLGISDGTYYTRRRKFLNDTYKLLEESGFGIK